MSRASGTFEVKLTPQAADEYAKDTTLGRLSIDKQFKGDLEATSKGQMLTAGTDVKESAGYVAIERVKGTLGGKKGTFILQHNGNNDARHSGIDRDRCAGFRDRTVDGDSRTHVD